MSMFDHFGTDSNLEKDGVWAEYGEFRIKVAHSGGANKNYSSSMEAETRNYRKAIQMGTLPEEKLSEILRKVFAESIITAWEVQKDGKWVSGIHSKEGGIIPFNKENVILSFKLLPHLFNDIQEMSRGISAYRKEILEEDSKNLPVS